MESPDPDSTLPIPLPTIEDVKSPLLDAIKSLRRWTVILFVIVATVTVTIFVIRSLDLAKVQHQASINTAALCALRADLKARVDNSKEFLKEHPGGIPGIPTATIRSQIEGQERTIKVLEIVECIDQ